MNHFNKNTRRQVSLLDKEIVTAGIIVPSHGWVVGTK